MKFLERDSAQHDPYSYTFFHYKHFVGMAYVLVLAARVAEGWSDRHATQLLWWLDTLVLCWVVFLLMLLTGDRLGHLRYAKISVLSLTVFHVFDLAVFLILGFIEGPVSWQRTAVVVLFSVFSVGPTVFLLWCDTHHYSPAARFLHAITAVRIVIILFEIGLFIGETLPQAGVLHGVSVVLAIGGHLMYEAALSQLARGLHRAANKAEGPTRR